MHLPKPGIAAFLALFASAALTGPAAAQTYPDRPIRLMVGFTAGSTVDAVARALADGLAKRLGQPVVVDNKTGANGALAVETMTRSKSDGYTLLVSNTSSLTINPLLYKSLGYSVPKDFAPITTIVTYPLVVTVNPNQAKTREVRTLPDLVALGKASPNAPLSFGSGGNGNMLHIAAERLARSAGFPATHIPYRGGTPMQIALLSGEVDFNFDTLSALPQVKAGKLRALAVSEGVRWEELPDVPTFAELGYAANEFSAWLGLLAPAGTPPAVIDTLHKAMVDLSTDPAIRARLQTQGRVSMGTPKALLERINKELAENAAVIKAANISLE